MSMDLSQIPPEALATMTAMIPPPGQYVDLDNPEDRAPLAIALCSVILGIMILCVGMRLYSKISIMKMFGVDDWLCIIAAVNTVAYSASALAGLNTGAAGPHMWNVRILLLTDKYFDLLLWGLTHTYVVQLTVRLSLFALILHIFGSHNIAKYLSYVGIAISCIIYPVMFVLTLVYCAPKPGGSSMMSIAAQKCQDVGIMVTIVQAGLNIGMDIYLLLIPQLVIWQLHVSNEKKLKVAVIFTLGLAATALSGVLLYYRLQYRGDPDTSWISVPVYICSIWEANLGMICACLPCMPALFKAPGVKNFFSLRSSVLRSWVPFSSTSSTSKSKEYGTNDSISLVKTTKITVSDRASGQDSFADVEHGWEMHDGRSSNSAQGKR